MFLKEIDILIMGFKRVGKNVLISDKASFYNAGNITIGDNVRIDDFCILSAGEGGIEIGSNIHIACYASIRGKEKVTLESNTNISAYSSILSSNDDYSGGYLMGPSQPKHLRKVDERPVTLKQHSIISERCTILPGVTIGPNSVVGIGSLVKKDIPENQVWAGIPVKYIKDRQSVHV